MPINSSTTPAPWVLEAARLPLAFAQVREDPRLDLEILQSLPSKAVIVMIASGGDTLIQLARHPGARRIHAVDTNPAQLALARLKCRLAENCAPDESCRILGHEPIPPEKREQTLAAHLDALGLAADVFGPPDQTAQWGADHAGRYERCFAELRRRLGAATGLLNEARLDAALAEVMSLPNLVALFGAEATQGPAKPFHEHFAERTREALARPDATRNPFLWQMCRGAFPPGVRYDWLESNVPPRAEVHFHRARMQDALEGMPAESADHIHLSNILDWLDRNAAAAALAAAHRVLKPGGRVIIRQLNSSLDIPASGAGFAWNRARGAAMVKVDRSFFYPRIHLGQRL